MAYRSFLLRAVTIALVAAGGCINAAGSGPPAEWFPLRRELGIDDLSGFRASFTPALSGDYAVTLKFQQPMESEEIRNLVNLAAANVGTDKTLARFDFDWQLLDGDKRLVRGTGRKGATGVIDTGSEGLGGGTLKSRALAFGEFRAEANRTYSFEFRAGPALAAVVGVRPTLEITLNLSSRKRRS